MIPSTATGGLSEASRITGEVFGVILLFLGKKYGVFAQATCDTKAIALPRGFMSQDMRERS